MGIKSVNVQEKTKKPDKEQKRSTIARNKITKQDETFYNQYSEINERLRNQSNHLNGSPINNGTDEDQSHLFGQLA
jgi:hypothetical protein